MDQDVHVAGEALVPEGNVAHDVEDRPRAVDEHIVGGLAPAAARRGRW